MNETRLAGLEGTNPLGFLAALGVQAAFASQPERPRLWWSADVTPRAVVDGGFTVERIAGQALEAFAEWKDGPALAPGRMRRGDELKLSAEDLRAYLDQNRGGGPGCALAAALVAEGSMDNQGASKPSDLYFTAGQQKFLGMARDILGGASRADLITGLEGPWTYESRLPSLMWDVADDRDYALTANDPSKEKKRTNPGPEALAILGLSLHPVFTGRDRTLTQGCSGSWKSGAYSWPLWHRPASPDAVRSLLAHAWESDQEPGGGSRRDRFRSWGVVLVLKSPIRRSGQGGYGTFGPSEVVWRAPGSR